MCEKRYKSKGSLANHRKAAHSFSAASSPYHAPSPLSGVSPVTNSSNLQEIMLNTNSMASEPGNSPQYIFIHLRLFPFGAYFDVEIFQERRVQFNGPSSPIHATKMNQNHVCNICWLNLFNSFLGNHSWTIFF